jgi:phospholipid/cholesterol/gamma-HCH transport system substrate-binding protein
MRRAGQSRITPVAAGAIAVVVILVIVYFGFTQYNPFHQPMKVRAAFKTVNDLQPNSPVRIAGVDVGVVSDVEAVQDRETGEGAIVTMEIEDEGLPLHRDMTLKIRPRIFLEGNWFVDVQPGSPSAPEVTEDDVIPVQQTAAPVQFGQVLTALQSDTREDLRIVLDEYGRALCGEDEDADARCKGAGAEGMRRSMRYWESAFRDSALVNQALLGREEHDLSGYLEGADRFARGINRDPEALKDLVTNLAITMQALAAEDVRLSESIEELPRTLTVGQSALEELNLAFPPLRRLVADLRPAVRAARPALDAQYPLLVQLRGLVSPRELQGLASELRRTVPHLVHINEEGVPMQRQLRLLSSCANNVLIPWRNDRIGGSHFEPSGRVFQEQVKWLPGIGAESRGFDANGQFVKSLAKGLQYAYRVGTNAGGEERFFLTGLPLQGVNPPNSPPPPFVRNVDCETQEAPDLRSNPQRPPPEVAVDFSLADQLGVMDRGREAAVKMMRDELREREIDIPVVERMLRRSDLPSLDRAPTP